MEITRFDLAAFTRDHRFYGDLNIALTIKSFELSAIRKRYLESKKLSKSRTGSVERREIARGGIATARLSSGNLEEFSVLARMPEPRAIDIDDEIVAFSSENRVFLIRDGSLKTLENPWFSYNHTVSLKGGKVLISSSGFDVIFEYDLYSGEKVSEWFAWENGFNKGFNPEKNKETFLTRNAGVAEDYKREGVDFLLIDDPAGQVLPTAQRAAFINSVVYDPSGTNRIIATFFHEGALYSIDLQTGESQKVLEGLKNPHGGMKYADFYVATSTASGEFVMGNRKMQRRIDFSRLSDKPPELKNLEWIQNTKYVGNNFISIDSNRNSFIIFNLEKRLYDKIPFDNDLAIQDLVISEISERDKKLIMDLGKTGS